MSSFTKLKNLKGDKCLEEFIRKLTIITFKRTVLRKTSWMESGLSLGKFLALLVQDSTKVVIIHIWKSLLIGEVLPINNQKRLKGVETRNMMINLEETIETTEEKTGEEVDSTRTTLSEMRIVAHTEDIGVILDLKVTIVVEVTVIEMEVDLLITEQAVEEMLIMLEEITSMAKELVQMEKWFLIINSYTKR